LKYIIIYIFPVFVFEIRLFPRRDGRTGHQYLPTVLSTGRSILLLLPSRVYNKPIPKAGSGPDSKETHPVKEHLEELLAQSLLHLQREGVLPAGAELDIQLERTRSPEHGEFASNLAMVLAKAAGRPPRELAQAIIDRLPKSR
jgi:hypothetical protein